MKLPRATALAAILALAVPLWSTPSAHAADEALCSTSDPAANVPGYEKMSWSTEQAITANFNAARAAEGCSIPFVLPAGYASMSPAQQMTAVMNLERTARGLAALKLDTTLMSQVSLNHAREMAQYGYFSHDSPINQVGVGDPGVGVPRINVNPALAKDFMGENIAAGPFPAALTAFLFLYEDGIGSNNLGCTAAMPWGCWGHRGAILQGDFNWTGVGVLTAPNSRYGGYTVVNFGSVHEGYVPPTTADTTAPTIGAISYADGTATVTGVADSGAPQGAAGVTGVVLYVNGIRQAGGFQGGFNTVPATQTAAGSGTWTARVAASGNDVVHAVAVDGSGNFTDLATAPPASTLAAGTSTIALPAAATTNGSAGARTTSTTAAVVPNARALARSVDRAAGGKVVRSVKVHRAGRWRVFRPGQRRTFRLYAGEGVVISVRQKVRWRATRGAVSGNAPAIHLRKGWNFVGTPYPIQRMTCHAVRLEIAGLGSTLREISIGARPGKGIVMKPKKGQWGNDLMAKIPNGAGYWIRVSAPVTWVPSPTLYDRLGPAVV